MADRAEFDGFVVARSEVLLRTAYLLHPRPRAGRGPAADRADQAWFAWHAIDGEPEPYVRRILATTFATWWAAPLAGRVAHRGPAREGAGR